MWREQGLQGIHPDIELVCAGLVGDAHIQIGGEGGRGAMVAVVVAEMADMVVGEMADVVVGEMADMMVGEMADMVVGEIADVVVEEVVIETEEETEVLMDLVPKGYFHCLAQRRESSTYKNFYKDN